MKNERSGRRVINESWDRKSSRDHHLTGPVAAVAQLVECSTCGTSYLREGKKIVYITGLNWWEGIRGKHGEGDAAPIK